MPYTVYVLYSHAYNKIYIGYSSDVSSRLVSHNTLATKGWTIKFRPWELVYTESFENKRDAMAREKALKSARGRLFIRQEIIEKLHPWISSLGSYPPAGGHRFESCPRY